MIAGGHAALAVSDLGRALRFYVETLGFKQQSRNADESAEVDAGGGFLLLLVQRAKVSTPPPSASVHIGFALNQPIADVIEVLSNRGVQFDGPVREDSGAMLATFRDPDGNLLSLVERAKRS